MTSVRVTITVPDDLNRGIQAARGWLLMNYAVDVSYSGFVETLARAGALQLARHFSSQPVLSDSDEAVLRESIETAYLKASGEFPETMSDVPSDRITAVMLPILLKSARAEAFHNSPSVYTKSGQLRRKLVEKREASARSVDDLRKETPGPA